MGNEPDAAVVLVCGCRPPSVNNVTGRGRDEFGAALAVSYKDAGRPRMDGLLYGVVCWFTIGYSPGTEPDADNISKGVWDILSDRKSGDGAGRYRLGAFADDKQVRVRVAGIFDLLSRDGDAPALSDLDLGSLPTHVLRQLESMVSDAVQGKPLIRHLTHIRFGRLSAAAYNLSPLGGVP